MFGEGNYHYFLFFFVSLLAVLLILPFQTIYVLYTINIGGNVGIFVMSILLTIYLFLGFLFVGTLLPFHLYLSSKNITTNQFCKDSWTTISGNPNSKHSIYKNILKILKNNYVNKMDPNIQLQGRGVQNSSNNVSDYLNPMTNVPSYQRNHRQSNDQILNQVKEVQISLQIEQQ